MCIARALSSRWSWIRQPAPGTFAVESGVFRLATQAADLFVDSNNASVLTKRALAGGPPGGTTWLRIAKVARGGEEHYVSYSSRDGVSYTRGGVWTHQLGAAAKLGLVAFPRSWYTR